MVELLLSKSTNDMKVKDIQLLDKDFNIKYKKKCVNKIKQKIKNEDNESYKISNDDINKFCKCSLDKINNNTIEEIKGSQNVKECVDDIFIPNIKKRITKKKSNKKKRLKRRYLVKNIRKIVLRRRYLVKNIRKIVLRRLIRRIIKKQRKGIVKK